MTDEKYQCNKHEVNPIINICFNCINAKTNRHDRMLEYLKYLAYEPLDRQNEVELISEECRELLQEIGEL